MLAVLGACGEQDGADAEGGVNRHGDGVPVGVGILCGPGGDDGRGSVDVCCLAVRHFGTLQGVRVRVAKKIYRPWGKRNLQPGQRVAQAKA